MFSFVCAQLSGKVVGMNSGHFVNFDFDNYDHSFIEITEDLMLTNHDPNGSYYYGADISVS